MSAPIGVFRSKTIVQLPAFGSGGKLTITGQDGTVITKDLPANTPVQIATPNAARRTAYFMNRTPGTTIDLGYATSLVPGTGPGIDGPSDAGGQGGAYSETPAHVGDYYAVASAAATLVMILGS